MMNFDMHNVTWWLGRCLRNLGALGLLGVAMLLICGMFYVTHVMPKKNEIQEAKYLLAQAQMHAASHVQEVEAAQTPVSTTSTQDVAAFYKLFPLGATLPAQIEIMEKTAIKQKLTLSRGDYKLTKVKQGQLMRYEIVFPLVGSYAQIRQFIASVLQKIPALALSDLQIKRENVASPTVQARLVFTLFLQGDSWLK